MSSRSAPCISKGTSKISWICQVFFIPCTNSMLRFERMGLTVSQVIDRVVWADQPSYWKWLPAKDGKFWWASGWSFFFVGIVDAGNFDLHRRPSWLRIIESTDLFKRAFIVLIVLALAEHGGVLAIVERPLDQTFHFRSACKYMQYRSVNLKI